MWRRGYGALQSVSTKFSADVFSACGGAALYRTACLRAVNGFDEDFFCYAEDIDLGFRLRLQGHSCRYVPKARVHHVGSAVTGKASDFSLYHGHRNLVWVYFKNMPMALLVLFLPLHILVNLVSIAWFVCVGRASVILKAKRDAVLGLKSCLRKRKKVHQGHAIPTINFIGALTWTLPQRRRGKC